MPCPVCVGVCRCLDAIEPSMGERIAAVIDPEHYSSSGGMDVTTALDAAARAERLAQLRPARRTIVLGETRNPDRSPEPGEWRREVLSRVNRYRARRRPRAERSRSLSLNFEPPSSSVSAFPLKNEAVLLPIVPMDHELSPRLDELIASAEARVDEPNASAQPTPVMDDSATALLGMRSSQIEDAQEQRSVAEPLNESALMDMQVEAYGVERCWPNIAPRNENPFWKHALAVVKSFTAPFEAAHGNHPQESSTVQEQINPFIMVNDFPVPEGTLVICSEQFDGSLISDLTEASLAAGNSMEKIVRLSPFEIVEINFEPATAGPPFEPEPEVLGLGEELAEPMMASTHIFEADEIIDAELAAEAELSVQPAPPIATVELPPVPENVRTAPQGRAFLPVAPMYLRTAMEAVDFGFAMAGFLLFSGILLGMGALPQGRAFTILAAVLPGFFWSMYQYLFLVNAAGTPGMWLTGLKLAGFDGARVSSSRRRARALSLAVSTFSLGLGFIWALFDEDDLCWHDRSSRTFVMRRNE
jgi:uncharacterized RDD family membrane protein YckC